MNAPTTIAASADRSGLSDHAADLRLALRHAELLTEAFAAHNDVYRGVGINRDDLAEQLGLILAHVEQAETARRGLIATLSALVPPLAEHLK